ncbi:MAG TPA: hypothetical protein VGY56_06890 [Verrucomicrobiae bacterium]|nr:hypothetical protein [Verrucomicrobiae bacterium]
MGNFYTNYTLRGPSQQSVANALAGRPAIVTREQDGCVVVFDQESDKQDEEIIAELASRLSGQFQCPLLAVLNHDDDMLWYQLYLSGELVDEYNSTPAYFEGDASGPEGCDPKKLCAAFGSEAGTELEGILRKPSAERSGYIFAFERHADLAGVLGIPSFGVGASFEAVSNGHLPDELTEHDLIKTRDLVPGPPLEDIWRQPVPGYYKVSFRANPKLTKSIPIGWMPGTWAVLERAEQELSEFFQKAAAPYREKFKGLGFIEQGFKKLKGVLNPNHRDDGGINYLDGSRRHFGQLIYNRSFIQHAEREHVIIAFTAVFDSEIVSCTNRMAPSDDSPRNHKVLRIESNDVEFLYQKFVERLGLKTNQPHRFDDLSALQKWYDANQTEIFEDKVRRGLWVRMSNYEAEKVRRKRT